MSKQKILDPAPEHRPAKPEPEEWVTEDEWNGPFKHAGFEWHRKKVNTLITRKYGSPPIVRTYNGESPEQFGLNDKGVVHPINKLRLLIEGRPYQEDLFQQLYDFLGLKKIKTYQWDKDDPEINVTDWEEHFDYIGMDDKGCVVRVENAIATKDTWIAGWYNPKTKCIETEEFSTEAEAQAMLSERQKGQSDD